MAKYVRLKLLSIKDHNHPHLYKSADNRVLIGFGAIQSVTELDPLLPEALRGTYLGLCSAPMLEHFRALGVTSIQLLPVHQAAPEAHLLAQNRRNYWGYAPVSFFAPSAAYATRSDGGQVAEFRQMVDTFHAAGFEVLLDVVFNHTAVNDR